MSIFPGVRTFAPLMATRAPRKAADAPLVLPGVSRAMDRSLIALRRPFLERAVREDRIVVDDRGRRIDPAHWLAMADKDELYLTFAPPLWDLVYHPGPCERCGEPVTGPGARYCSGRCRAAAWRDARQAGRSPES